MLWPSPTAAAGAGAKAVLAEHSTRTTGTEHGSDVTHLWQQHRHQHQHQQQRVFKLSSFVCCCRSVRHGGVREYDTHNLFGTAMAHDHYKAVKSITGKRPFLLSRYEHCSAANVMAAVSAGLNCFCFCRYESGVCRELLISCNQHPLWLTTLLHFANLATKPCFKVFILKLSAL
jgi:hypothetical protein